MRFDFNFGMWGCFALGEGGEGGALGVDDWFGLKLFGGEGQGCGLLRGGVVDLLGVVGFAAGAVP